MLDILGLSSHNLPWFYSCRNLLFLIIDVLIFLDKIFLLNQWKLQTQRGNVFCLDAGKMLTRKVQETQTGQENWTENRWHESLKKSKIEKNRKRAQHSYYDRQQNKHKDDSSSQKIIISVLIISTNYISAGALRPTLAPFLLPTISHLHQQIISHYRIIIMAQGNVPGNRRTTFVVGGSASANSGWAG